MKEIHVKLQPHCGLSFSARPCLGNLSDRGLEEVDSDSSDASRALMNLFSLTAQDSWLELTGSASDIPGFHFNGIPTTNNFTLIGINVAAEVLATSRSMDQERWKYIKLRRSRMIKNSIAAILAILSMGAQGASVLEYDAADLSLAGDASGVVWAPSVSTTNVLNCTLGAGSSVVAPASAYFSRSVSSPNSGVITSFKNAGLGANATADFSFELWVKPADLIGEKILFETGGSTIGTSLLLIDDTIHFVYAASGTPPVADVIGVLASTPSDFIQIVGVTDVSVGLTLYINGAAVDSASATVGNWAGANGGHFGGTDGNVAKPSGFVPTDYEGELALARFYDSALTSSEIAVLYSTIVPDISVPTGLLATGSDGSVSLDWYDNSQASFDLFTVYRSTTSGSGYSVIAQNLTASEYVDNAVINGATYYYVVTATDTNGISSGYSAETAATPAASAINDSLVLEYDAADLSLVGNAEGTVWAPSVKAGTTLDYDFALGAGSSVITPDSVYFNRSVSSPNSSKIKTFKDGFATGATTDFTFELWVKPADLSGDKILFETGGSTIGTSILLIDNTIHFVHTSAGAVVADVAGVLASMPSDFIQIVGVTDVSAGLSLYINGAVVNSASSTVGNWAGADHGRFGSADANVAKPAGFVPTVYEGELALARFYESALTSGDVTTLYDAFVPEIDIPTGFRVSNFGDGFVALDWEDNGQAIFDSFTVYRSTTSGSGYSAIAVNLTASTYTDNSVVNDTVYYYKVRATDINGITSAYSTEIAGAPFTPSTEDGLIVHLDASTGTVLTDGSGNVASWVDLTGNGNDASPTAGGLPVTFPSANLSDKGLAGVDSDSSGGSGSLARMDLFTLAAQKSWLDFTGSASANSGFSVLAAVQCDTLLGGSIRDVVMGNHGDSASPNNLILRCENGATKAVLDGNVFESGASLPAGATVVLALNYDATTGEVVFWDSYSDNSVTGSVAATDFSGVGTLRLFGTPNPDQGMDGMIGEVKIYSKLLDASKFVSEREAMKAKWADNYVAAPTVPAWKNVDSLLAWSPATDPDSAFYKSGVPLQDRFWALEALKANANAKAGQGSIQSLDLFNGYPTGNPVMGEVGSSRYTFSYWQYLDESVYWGGIAGVGIIIPPSPEMIDNAHRNGVPILGTIFFPPTVYGGDYAWVQDFLQKSNGTYIVADKLIEVAEHLGFDGWFINQETVGGDAADAVDMRDMIKYIRDNSEVRISWYDSMIESGQIWWQDQFNTRNDWYMRYPENSNGDLIADSMFLDFVVNSTTVQTSRDHAIDLGLDPYKLYAGLETQAEDFKTSTSARANLSTAFPDGANHITSVGLYRPNQHATSLGDQDLFWSGSSGDPRDTTTPVGTGNWHGIAHHVAARSVINSLPFATDFCLGRGTKYFIDGGQVWNKNWWNRSQQAILPTWRWIINSAGTKLTPELSLADAYQGGSHLRISGNLDAENILQLYLMDLPASADTQLKIVFKRGDGSASGADAQMDVGVSMVSDPTSFTYYDVGGYSNGWNEAVINLGAHSGENMAALNLRFTGAAPSYEMRVGMISIYNSSDPAPVPPTNVVELDVGVRADAVDGRVAWNHASGDVYYYNVYIRNADGTLSYVGSTANNYYYFGNIPYSGDFSSVVVETVGSGFVRSLASDENLPVLGEGISGSNFRLSWPQGSGSFVVESSSNLVEGGWAAVTGATVIKDNGTNYVELPIGANRQLFYRLKK